MEQRSEEWFDIRRGRVTGSMVGAILGLSPNMTRDDAMRRMVRDNHKAPSEFTGNIATEWGVANEAGARLEFTMETGLSVRDCAFYAFEDWLGASPDGLIGDSSLIEIKCPFGLRDKNPPEFKSALDQPHYYAQMQIQLFCSDRESCFFYQWAPKGSNLQIIDRNDDWLSENLPALRAFWLEYQEEINNPEHLEPKRKVIETVDARKLIDEYDNIAMAIDAATERKAEIMGLLEKISGGRDSLICGRKFTKVERQGAISYAKAIKAIAPNADLEPYRGQATSYFKLG